MPFCVQCGVEYAAGTRFCSGCGRALDGAAPVVAAPTAEPIKQRLRTSLPDFVRKTLHPSEQVYAAFSASLFDHRSKGEFRHDKFALTNERIIYYHTGIVHKGMGEMPYKTITAVQYSKSWLHGKVVIEAANAGLTIDGIANDDALFVEKLVAGIVAGRSFTLAP
ncbi:MAG TPA: PH domain-containing protein [Chloroflexota bacterium]